MKYLQQLLAGILIGIGGMAYLNTMPEFWAPFIFSIGLISVVLMGAQLYTGRIGYFPLQKSQFPRAVLNYAGMLVLNLLGAALAGCAARVVYTIDVSGIVTAKSAQQPIQAFLLACGCGIMMYLAVEGYRRTKSLVLIIFPVAVFIFCKFDHCVADMFYFAYAGQLPPVSYMPAVVAGNTVGALALRLLSVRSD